MYYASDLTLNQGTVFMYALFGGMVIGVFYCLHEFLKIIFNKKWYKVCLDVLLCLEIFLVLIFVLYWLNRGVIKSYAIFGMVVGCLAFNKAFLAFFKRIGIKIHERIAKFRNKSQ